MNMKNMTHVWKCSNWNEFFVLYKHQPQSSFKNLTTIYLFGCNRIKYLFSPLMVKLLSNLKKIIISYCDGMENVISDRDDKNEEMAALSTHTRITLFPRLELLRLNKLENLKHIGGLFYHVDIVTWSLCQYSREIKIKRCDALSSVIPSYAAGQMQKLQTLSIEYCSSMMEVFETKEIDSNNSSFCSSTIIASRSPTTMHIFPSLMVLNIEGCDCLEYIFTFSTIESLKKLEKLTIRYCKKLKVVVREENREHTTTSMKDVVFPRLKSVELDCLPNFAGFFSGMNIDFQWPLLDYVMINDCSKMMMFTSGRSTAPRLKYIHTRLGKHNLECGLNFYVKPVLHQIPSASLYDIDSDGTTWSFHNLVECNWGYYYDTKIFPSNEMQKLQKLETIHVKDCANVEEVFEVALGVINNESETVVKIPMLRKVDLDGLRSLKYIWKSSQRRILEFPNLTILSISKCNTLEHVFTSSMVDCVMQLQELHIQSCRNMKVIVKEEDHDVKQSEIIFPCLKSLKLDDLSSLRGFCLGEEDVTLPSLDTLVIKKCPTTMVFTAGRSVTRQLTMVETSFGCFKAWDDINSFIMTKKQEVSLPFVILKRSNHCNILIFLINLCYAGIYVLKPSSGKDGCLL
ncbi:putative leucine-rich repeat domain superfamily [Helianthus anomalus]